MNEPVYPALAVALVPPGGAGWAIGLAGTLQLCVAIYAIRLNRLYGSARVGWSLFWAFSLLALLHFVQSVTPPKRRRVLPSTWK